MRTTSLWIGLVFTALTVNAIDVDLGTHGTMSFDAPLNWNVKTMTKPGRTEEAREHVVTLEAPSGSRGLVELVVIPYSKPPEKEAVQQKIKRTVEAARSHQPSAEVGPIKDFALKNGFGSYGTITSSQPSARHRGYKTYGMALIHPGSGVAIIAAIYADSAESKEFSSVVDALNTISIKAK